MTTIMQPVAWSALVRARLRGLRASTLAELLRAIEADHPGADLEKIGRELEFHLWVNGITPRAPEHMPLACWSAIAQTALNRAPADVYPQHRGNEQAGG